MELRKSPRIRVRFRSSFSSPQMMGGEGEVLDLSVGGCRISSSSAVSRGTLIEARLHTSDQEPPVEIELAAIRWVKGREFGTEFLRLGEEGKERIGRLIDALKATPGP
jgi:hypothetical protein